MYIPVFGRKFHNHFKATILVSLACSALSGTTLAATSDFKTFDMMGFDYVPTQHQDKGLERIPVLYQCSMFRADHIRGVNYCNNIDMSEPNTLVIQQRAAEYLGVPIVAINIEGGNWRLLSRDIPTVEGAVGRWQDLIKIWQEVNPDTTILIFGGVPRAYWAIGAGNWELMQIHTLQTQKIAAIFDNKNTLYNSKKVALWPSAYVHNDNPDIYRAERKWQINVCHNVYKTQCYFAIKPQYGNTYYDSGTGFRLHMDQKSFLDVMTTLKEDGADGIGLWINIRHLSENYEDRMQEWSLARNTLVQNFERELTWMIALEKFLDANNRPAGEVDSASYCVDSILATAAYSCPAVVSQQLEDWGWLKRYSRNGDRN